MVYELEAKAHFSSAHALRGYGGDCERLHGHNFRVLAVVYGGELDSLGLLIDFRELNELLGEVVGELDHRDLNSLPAFNDKNPSSEVLAEYIFERLSALLGEKQGERVRVKQITVWESEGYGATYRP